jgi:hypothetical protein
VDTQCCPAIENGALSSCDECAFIVGFLTL